MSKILIIDDNGSLRKLIRQLMETAGHCVHEAENGRLGMLAFEQLRPDLVITDIIMPEQEGLETIVRMGKQRRDVRIVAISGGGVGSKEDYLYLAEKMGADRVMAKPFDLNAFADMVQELLTPDPGRNNPA
jgi:DNA-binding response OmpR family regulator